MRLWKKFISLFCRPGNIQFPGNQIKQSDTDVVYIPSDACKKTQSLHAGTEYKPVEEDMRRAEKGMVCERCHAPLAAADRNIEVRQRERVMRGVPEFGYTNPTRNQ